jgi:hypothetical protein
MCRSGHLYRESPKLTGPFDLAAAEAVAADDDLDTVEVDHQSEPDPWVRTYGVSPRRRTVHVGSAVIGSARQDANSRRPSPC